jgi:hypothetical protein
VPPTTALNKKLGIFVRPAAGFVALSALAADLPAPVLADLLGRSITTATRWSALAARDNAEYVATRIESPRREPTVYGRCPGKQRIVVGAHS